VTWNRYTSGKDWDTGGGDLVDIIAVRVVSTPGYSSSFAYDVTKVTSDWGERGSIVIRDVSENSSTLRSRTFFGGESVGTTAWMPHVVMSATDDPPAAITDLTATPDTSLSESSHTYRQRAVLRWSASGEDDFRRYRIRFGKNRSLAANLTHLAFINSRGTTSYLDTTLYSDGTTIYYSIYPEDTRNGSTSTALGATYTNVSNVVSWQKPQVSNLAADDFSPDVLQEVTATVRAATMTNAKQAKIVWGDNGVSFTQTLTSAGGYFTADHRYTSATTTGVLRCQVEDIYGFRSNTKSTGTLAVSNLGPVAKLVASPTRQRTASTYSFGGHTGATVTSAGLGGSGIVILTASSALSHAEGLGLSLRIKRTAGNKTSATFYLMRDEGAYWRVKYVNNFTWSTTATEIRRDVNWRVARGDMLAVHLFASGSGGSFAVKALADRRADSVTTSTVLTVGKIIPKWRGTATTEPMIRISYALTNPVHFSAKDSFARSSNRFLNRFRWDTSYNGTFGSNYETGATTSFYYAWTDATNAACVAVRAVDNSHASSIDVAGVVVTTESTFRIPDDLRDGMKTMSDDRGRSFTISNTLMRDYGALDFGAIEPVTITVSGESYSLGTSTTWIDIDRLSAAFQQRKRIYIIPPWSTSTAVQGYIMEPPVSRDAGNPITKKWNLKIVVTT